MLVHQRVIIDDHVLMMEDKLKQRWNRDLQKRVKHLAAFMSYKPTESAACWQRCNCWRGNGNSIWSIQSVCIEQCTSYWIFIFERVEHHSQLATTIGVRPPSAAYNLLNNLTCDHYRRYCSLHALQGSLRPTNFPYLFRYISKHPHLNLFRKGWISVFFSSHLGNV